MGTRGRAVPERDGQDSNTVNPKRVQGGAGPDNIGDGIVCPDFVEVGVGPVHLLFRALIRSKTRRAIASAGAGTWGAAISSRSITSARVRWAGVASYPLSGHGSRPGNRR